jgi:hypothetical protein
VTMEERIKAIYERQPLLLQFIGEISRCRRMLEVVGDVDAVLTRLGLDDLEWDNLDELTKMLSDAGVVGFDGLSLWEPAAEWDPSYGWQPDDDDEWDLEEVEEDLEKKED